MQVRGLFDLQPSKTSTVEWDVHLDLPTDWNIGLIVGPSGAGKTTIARELFGDSIVSGYGWPTNRSIVDGFPTGTPIKQITQLLSSVGLSSPPTWLRPYQLLSNGEQFRVTLARALAEPGETIVFDEFTSVVDRTVAQIGSAAVAKAIRSLNRKFIAISCHYDVAPWLCPDWIYEPAVDKLTLPRGSLQRPPIELTINRVHHSAWQLFRKHHYLDTNLQRSARSFVAEWNGVPVAFSAWQAMPSGTVENAWVEHRTVTLPDYQGVGIGSALSEAIASTLKAIGKRAYSRTSHPAVTKHRVNSSLWRVTGLPALGKKDGGTTTMKRSTNRLSAGFEYIGPAMEKEQAIALWSGDAPSQPH
jgi:energy-coupling factor transporter ATP-binding protein EcfA2/GNAT superfamily N-acetyltransferase